MSDSEDLEPEPEGSGDDETTSADVEDGPAIEELQEEVTRVRTERDELAERVEQLEAEREDLESRVKRTAADFENYKKRQEKKREQAAAAATERLVERLLDVRDNLQRAIDQSTEEGESLREGVKLTLAEFDRVLDAEEVSEIAPEPGASVDPNRHEVMVQVEGEQPAGRIEEVYQPGYAMDSRVIRPAQVVVSTDADGED